MSVSGVRTMLYRKRMSLYYNRMQQFEEVVTSLTRVFSSHETFPTLDTWKGCFSTPLPSVHALSSCFLADFGPKTKHTLNACNVQRSMRKHQDVFITAVLVIPKNETSVNPSGHHFFYQCNMLLLAN